MIRAILLIGLYTVITHVGIAQEIKDIKLYVVEDTVIRGIDTINLIHTKLKVWRKSKKQFLFQAAEGDTILYSLQKENNTRMKYKVIKPNAEEIEYTFNDSINDMRLPTDGGAGNYILELKNRSFKTNHVIIDLKKAQGWQKIEKIKKDPPKEDSIVVVINDTIPRVILEGTYYVGAKKNIREQYEKAIEFKFSGDSIPCYWSYIVGFGKEYETAVNNLTDLKTQQPVGDPVVAYFMKQYREFPYSESKRAQMSLTGPTVNAHFSKTDFGLYNGRNGVYKLSVTNKDEVVGEYIYFKVVAFDMVKKSEVKVPLSEFKKMKIAQCTSK